jgi:uncharacterized protein YcfJ
MMKGEKIKMNRVFTKKLWIVGMVFVFAAVSGCASMDKAQTGGLAGAGMGALIGQAIGGNTTATLIGTGVGLGLGYLIGNEMDKDDAKKRQTVREDETRLLANTTWKVKSINPRPKKPYASIVTTFSPNGNVTTTTTYPDGTVKREVESYRIVGSTLIINKPDYVINSRFRVEGNMMYLDTGEHSVVMERLKG